MVNQEQTIEELSKLAKTNAEEALISIKKMIKKYPYFNALRVLELEVLKSSNAKFFYKSALRSSIATYDRSYYIKGMFCINT